MVFKKQLSNVVEWEEFNDEMIFWKWHNKEIKKGSRLIIRPGQDAIFLNSGRIEGIFKDEGDYDIESQIIPFLSTLRGFRFGFNSGMRAEILFVNTKEFTVKWGTKSAINIPYPQLPGGLPIRANGTFNIKVNDYIALIDKVAGIKSIYLVEDVRLRIISILDQLLMKWISKEGKDMFNLQANSFDISKGIREDLDMSILKDGLTITGFNIMSFSYPEEIQKMITKSASHSMIGNVGKYQQVEMVDGIASGKVKGGGIASDMAGMMMGMNVASEMMKQMNKSNKTNEVEEDEKNNAKSKPNFCSNCGTKAGTGNFCSNCGEKL